MSNGEDFVLTLMKPKKLDPVAYPETFQVGCYPDDSAAVQAKPSAMIWRQPVYQREKSMGPHRAWYSFFLLWRSSECAGQNRHTRLPAAELRLG